MLRIDLHESDTATCGELSVTYAKGPICRLARKLVEVHPEDTPVEVWRGETLCFAAVPLSRWAGVSVSEPEHGRMKLVRYRPLEGAFMALTASEEA